MPRHALPVVAAVLVALPASAQHFSDVSADTGTQFTHQSTPPVSFMSGGMAWFDMDRDGDDDLFLVSSGSSHGLLRNDAGSFTDISPGSGLTGVPLNGCGAAVGDYDQDGYPDLYVTHLGANHLYRNLEGSGAFEDVTEAVGLGGGSAWSTSAVWGDWDRDGDLDLYVGNYVDEVAYPYHIGDPNQFWVNEGSAAEPLFVDRAAELGLDLTTVFGEPHPDHPVNPNQGLATAATTLSLNAVDYDDDGDQDLLVGNDFGPFIMGNKVFRNDTPPGGPLHFTDVSEATGLAAFPQFNMGIVSADYDLDGDWDLYLTDMGPNILFRNDDGVFVDVSDESGPVGSVLPSVVTSWAALWEDFDNDGLQDLYVVNGYILAAVPNKTNAKNRLYRNLGDGSFANVGPTSGLQDPGMGRGAGGADFDGDGLLDIQLMNNGDPLQFPIEPCKLFHNQGTLGDPGNGWAQLRLVGERSNTEALGARVDVEVGGVVLKRQVKSATPYLSTSSRMLHVGLGPETRMDRLVVRWPSGTYQEWHDVPGFQQHELVEPRAVIGAATLADREGARRLLAVVDNLHDGETTVSALFRAVTPTGEVLERTVVRTLAPGASARLTVPLPAGLEVASWRVEVRDQVLGALDVRAG